MEEDGRRTLVMGAVALLVVVVVIGGFLIWRHDPKAELTVKSIPNDLALTLDGAPIAANGTTEVRPGTYTLEAKRNGFESYTQTLTLRGKDPVSVKMYLYANGPVGAAWGRDHPDQQLEAEAEAGRKYDQIQDVLEKKYPILASLPYIGIGFKATYGQSRSDPHNPAAISVTISSYLPEGKEKAMEWIAGNRWDPATLDLVFVTS